MTKTKQVWYLAHPVSGDHIGNALKAVQWIKWFAHNAPHMVVIAPWVAEVLAFPEAMPKAVNDAGGVGSWEWALANDEIVVSKLDGIVLVGGTISRGMQRELDCARREGKAVMNLSQFATPSDLPVGFSVGVFP